jgi:hypothetical protein
MHCETIKKPCPFQEDKRPLCDSCPIRISWLRLGLDMGYKHLLFKDEYPVILEKWHSWKL